MGYGDDNDPADRLTNIVAASGSFAWTYNPDNGLAASMAHAASGIGAAYGFDIADRLTNIAWTAVAPATSFAMQYSAADMITNIVYAGGERRAYTYDSLDRLTGEQRFDATDTLVYSAAYAFDLAGNRTQTVINGVTNTYTLGLGNRLASWTGGSYGHDAAGCVTQITDAAGIRTLTWNSQYQLTAVATNGALAESYGHDPLGRRAWTSDGSVTNWHVYDGMHVVADLDDSGEVLRSYTWGPGIDNLLALTVHGATETNTYYAITDHLGTVHALADDTGGIVESYRFDAWGNVLGVFDGTGQPISGSAIGNRYLFQGREYSWATGLYNFRARWYDPATGRWLSNDPIGINGGLNQFVAFDNNPVMLRDPFGLCADHSREEVEAILSDIRYRLDRAGFLSTRLPSAIMEAIGMHAIPGPRSHDYDAYKHAETWDVPGFDRPLVSNEFGNYLAGYSSGYLGFGTYWGVRAGGIFFASGHRIYDMIRRIPPTGEHWSDRESVPMIKAGRAAAEAFKVERARQYREKTPFWVWVYDSVFILF